ncbi:MAG TPA: hypothetical protein VFT62_07020 [Mycobacteriales bacterium]|nr:hypothetical protein [Mycobacteriales bacterium]
MSAGGIAVSAVAFLVIAALVLVAGRQIRRDARGEGPVGRAVLWLFVRVPGLRSTVREPFRTQYAPNDRSQ